MLVRRHSLSAHRRGCISSTMHPSRTDGMLPMLYHCGDTTAVASMSEARSQHIIRTFYSTGMHIKFLLSTDSLWVQLRLQLVVSVWDTRPILHFWQ